MHRLRQSTHVPQTLVDVTVRRVTELEPILETVRAEAAVHAAQTGQEGPYVVHVEPIASRGAFASVRLGHESSAPECGSQGADPITAVRQAFALLPRPHPADAEQQLPHLQGAA
jgi:hypothetical protein